MKRTVLSGGCSIQYELEYKKVKNINLRIHPDGTVSVSASRRHPVAVIDAFVIENFGAIQRAAAKYNCMRQTVPAPVTYEEGEYVSVLGNPMEIVLRKGTRNEVFSEDGKLVISMRDPENESGREKAVQQWLAGICSAVVLDCCRQFFPVFAPYCGGIIPEITFRRMRSRWGSCTPSKRLLTFNTRLAHAPRECIEYVVVHEFAHFVHPDHSPQFYKTVAEVLPDWKERRAAIRNYEILMN